MGLLFKVYLSPEKGHIFACSNCRTHFTTNDLIISKQFQGQHGRAFLFNKVVNVAEGEPQTRSMTTGLHTTGSRYILSTLQHCGGMEIWESIRRNSAIQRGQIYPRKGAAERGQRLKRKLDFWLSFFFSSSVLFLFPPSPLFRLRTLYFSLLSFF